MAAIVGPCDADILHVRGRFPSGQPINVNVTLLGEFHTPAIPPGPHDVTTLQLLERAADRARATDQCVDIYLEHSIMRAVKLSTGREFAQQRFHLATGPHVNTLNLLRYDLVPCIPKATTAKTFSYTSPHKCPLGRRDVRVHTWDIRPNLRRDASNAAALKRFWDATLKLGPPDLGVQQNYRKWTAFFMGMDPTGGFTDQPWPQAWLNELTRHFLGGDKKLLPGIMSALEAGFARVRKRVAKIGVDNARFLAYYVIEAAGVPVANVEITSQATNFYILLRMFAPNIVRAGSPCAASVDGAVTPHTCIVYAGAAHTKHVQNILAHMTGQAFDKPTDSPFRKRVPLTQVTVDGHPGKIKTVDRLLAVMFGEGGALPSHEPPWPPARPVPDKYRAPKHPPAKYPPAKPTKKPPAKPARKPPPASSVDALRKLTVVKLKDRLRKRGLPVSGRKEQLIRRLLGR